MPIHYKFFFDLEGWEEKIKKAFESSELRHTKNLIIVSSGRHEAVIMLPKQLFFDYWDEIIAGAIWQIIVFSEDFELIMETSSNDSYLHSNFKIMDF